MAVTLTPKSLPAVPFSASGMTGRKNGRSMHGKTKDSRSPPSRSTLAASQSTTIGFLLSPYLLTTGSRCKPDSSITLTLTDPSKTLPRHAAAGNNVHIDADGQPGGRTCIIHTSDTYYSARDIEKALPSKKMHDKMVEANRYTDYKPRSLDEIREALDKVPARKAGTGTYHIYRNLFWGLIKACEEAGSTRDQAAISLMQSNSPSWKGLQQIASSGGEKGYGRHVLVLG